MLPLDEPTVARLETQRDDFGGATEAHLRADLVLERGAARQVHRFRVWDDLPVIVQSVVLKGSGEGWGTIDEPPLIDAGVSHYRPAADRIDAFHLAEPQLAWECVALLGRSDHRDSLVQTSRGVVFGKETTRLSGHLLHVTRWDGGAGLVAMKLAPPPDEQINNAEGCDFVLSGGYLSICGSGVVRADLATGTEVETYGSAVGVTDGRPESAAELFRELMRRLAPPRTPKRGVAHANNWGGGGGTKILSEDFVTREVDAARRVGINHYQIDAGWHRGEATRLLVEQLEPGSTSAADERFWDVHPERFPRGLGPVADRAKAAGIELGLWYCLDRADDYVNWRRDLERLLSLWTAHGVTHFKFDGLSFASRLGESRVLALFRELFERSGGAVAASVDITGSKSRRLGVAYGTTHVRDHFLENRYTRNRTYWPHRTLRNLWQLARFVPTYRLEVEWVDTSRNTEVYGDHSLAPARFGTEYSLATALFALPLAWMHVQHLPGDAARDARRLLDAFLPHQYEILTGRVDPIGEEPSGEAWTGFCSRHCDDHGYLLLFREANERPACRLRVPGAKPGAALTLQRLAGRGRQRRVVLDQRGSATFKLQRPRSFSLYRWRVETT